MCVCVRVSVCVYMHVCVSINMESTTYRIHLDLPNAIKPTEIKHNTICVCVSVCVCMCVCVCVHAFVYLSTWSLPPIEFT